MLNIESEIFHPIEDKKEFRVHLRAPSFSEFQDAQIEADKLSPAGGPDLGRSSESYKILVERLLDLCVEKVEGLQINGKLVETSQDLRMKAPKYLSDKIVAKILKLANPEAEQIKN